jgi:hypothetical protein
MFKEQLLIFKGPNNLNTEVFDDILSKKATAREGIRRFHNSKNKKTAEETETDFQDSVQNDIDLSDKQELAVLSLDLKRQLEASLTTNDRFIDTQTAEIYLEEIKQKRDPQRLREIMQDIKARRRNVALLINELDTNGVIRLSGNESFSILRPQKGLDISKKEEFLQEFLQLTPSQQQKRLVEIKTEIKELIDDFHQLLNYLDKKVALPEIENFRLLSDTDRKSRLKEYKKTTELFKRTLQNANLPASLEKEQIQLFKEQGLEGRKHQLRVLEQNLNQPSQDKEFAQAHKKRQSQYPEFSILSKSEKEKVLNQIRAEIKEEYLDKFHNHKYFYLVGKPDIQVMEGTFSGQFEIQMGEACLQWLDKTMEGFQELNEQEKKFPISVLQHFNWENLSYFEKKNLLKTKGKIEQYSETKEHLELDTSYKKRLTEYLNTKPIGLINPEGFKSYMDWFQDLPLNKKQDIIQKGQTQKSLDYLELTKSSRIKQNQKFLKLPKNIQKEYYDEYLDSDFEERKKLLRTIKQRTNDLNRDFKNKLDEVIEAKLLSPKSRKRYWKMFSINFNLQQREDYLNDCNLDRNERKELLEEFETEVLIMVPTELQDKIAKQFYDLDLRKREKLIKQLKVKYKPKSKKEEDIYNARKKAKKKEQKLDTVGAISKEGILREHFLKRASQLEANKDLEGALRFYQESLDLDIELSEAETAKIKAKIKELETKKENYTLIQSTQFDEMIKSEVENMISDSEVLRKEQRILTLIEEAFKLQETNERYYEQSTDAQLRMHKSLDDGYTREANQAFQEHTDGEYSFYVDQWGDVEIGQELTFDVNEFDTLNELPFWMDYFSDVQDLPKEARADARFTAINGQTGETISSKKFQQELLDPIKDNFITDSIAPELFTRLEVTDNPELQQAIIKRLQRMSLTQKLPKTNKDNLSAQ